MTLNFKLQHVLHLRDLMKSWWGFGSSQKICFFLSFKPEKTFCKKKRKTSNDDINIFSSKLIRYSTEEKTSTNCTAKSILVLLLF